jgi:hypothetical protein
MELLQIVPLGPGQPETMKGKEGEKKRWQNFSHPSGNYLWLLPMPGGVPATIPI